MKWQRRFGASWRAVLLVGSFGLVGLDASAGTSFRELRDHEAVAAVMEYREVWLEDRTPFDACKVFDALGRPDNFPDDLGARGGRLLNTTAASPCTDHPPVVYRADTRIVRVDSIRLEAPTPTVHLSVTKGERVHREDYRFNEHGRIPELLIYGRLRLHR